MFINYSVNYEYVINFNIRVHQKASSSDTNHRDVWCIRTLTKICGAILNILVHGRETERERDTRVIRKSVNFTILFAVVCAISRVSDSRDTLSQL